MNAGNKVVLTSRLQKYLGTLRLESEGTNFQFHGPIITKDFLNHLLVVSEIT